MTTLRNTIDITHNLFTEEEIFVSKDWRKNHGKFMGRQNGSFWLKRTQSEYSSCMKEIYYQTVHPNDNDLSDRQRVFPNRDIYDIYCFLS